MSTSQNQPNDLPPTATEIEAEHGQPQLHEDSTRPEETVARIEETIRKGEEEVYRLQGDRRQVDEEIHRLEEDQRLKNEDLLGIRRVRDAMREHQREIELRVYKREHKELNKRLTSVTLQALRFTLKLVALKLRKKPVPAETIDDFVIEKIIPLEAQLSGVQSRILQIKAERLGIDTKSHIDWWNDNNFEELSAAGRHAVSHLAREERRRNMEWWVKVLVPIAAVVISLLSLLIALIAVSKK